MELKLPKPKAILFDWDNTLMDSWPVIHAAMSHCFAQMGKTPWTLEEVKIKVAHSMRDEFPKLFGDRWQEAGKHYQEGYLAIHCDRLQPFSGAKETVEQIQQAGIYQAVVSNKKGPTLRKEADHLGWKDYFHALVGADDAEFDKPHPSHAEMALQPFTASFDGQEVWFVGDNAVDMEIAKNSGFTAVFYGSEQEAERVTHPIHARVDDHQQLQSLIADNLLEVKQA
jgi:phosphoglycolate phosphatase